MKKRWITLAFTLVLALALSASAQADMDAATALVESYVNYYNILAVFAETDKYNILPIDTGSKLVEDSGKWIGYDGELDVDSPPIFIFYIDDATSGISEILINLSTEDFKDHYQDMLASMFSFALLAGIDTTNGFGADVGKKAADALLTCMGLGDDILLTDPVSSGALSVSFMVYDETLNIDMEFNPPLTRDPGA